MSNFSFLIPEWTSLHEAAVTAERMANLDARAACFYARRTLELAMAWLYKHVGRNPHRGFRHSPLMA